ncbi:hypothetical protein INN71_11750 [Nocardioides sp. ChNu-153]|uniref:hypothetical protein n=1 Tax=Nocardioides sp. ChNu-153 TaxID=2779364 RepID=UPI00265437B6|nr:hypothetical protein [Nocardioides sp. ChNu-153]MDN7122062.1 hypothetical protein [Nocardioides sp. ChNu-153]
MVEKDEGDGPARDVEKDLELSLQLPSFGRRRRKRSEPAAPVVEAPADTAPPAEPAAVEPAAPQPPPEPEPRPEPEPVTRVLPAVEPAVKPAVEPAAAAKPEAEPTPVATPPAVPPVVRRSRPLSSSRGRVGGTLTERLAARRRQQEVASTAAPAEAAPVEAAPEPAPPTPATEPVVTPAEEPAATVEPTVVPAPPAEPVPAAETEPGPAPASPLRAAVEAATREVAPVPAAAEPTPPALVDRPVEEPATEPVAGTAPVPAEILYPDETDQQPGEAAAPADGAGADGGEQRRTGSALLTRLRTFELPPLPETAAVAATGLVTGLLVAVLATGSLRLCSVVQGTGSCGSPVLLLLVAVLVIAVVLGARLLSAWKVSEPGSTSFLALGLVAFVVLVFLLDVLFSWVALLVVPVVAVAMFLLAHLLTDKLAEGVPDAEPPGR